MYYIIIFFNHRTLTFVSLLQVLNCSRTVHVYSPKQDSFNSSKWFLYQRRHDAVRLFLRLAVRGHLPRTLDDRPFELVFCPRDCVMGAHRYEYNGMPKQWGPLKVGMTRRRAEALYVNDKTVGHIITGSPRLWSGSL